MRCSRSLKNINYSLFIIIIRFIQVPFCDALAEEFRIVIRFSENERPLKSAQSIYSRSRNSSQSIESLKTDSEENMPVED